MIDDITFAQRWNAAGPQCTADMLGFIFRELQSSDDVAKHNLVWNFVLKRLDDNQLRRFFVSVADLIERYSTEIISHGTQKESRIQST